MELNKIYQGDALEVLKTFPDESINCVITSPPYWALRDYGVSGQLGLEPTFKEYIDKLCNIYDEVYRVLAKDGSCWINLGDTYFGGGRNSGGKFDKESKQSSNKGTWNPEDKTHNFEWGNYYRDKSICLIPSRFAIAMIDHGWILRNDIIWHKRNCMPSSAEDRFTVDYEHVFFFVKNKKYYFEKQYEEWGEDEREAGLERARKYGYEGKGTYQDWYFNERNGKDWTNKKVTKDNLTFSQATRGIAKQQLIHPFGRNKRCIWDIPSQPFLEAHFATFPEQLVETPLLAGCPEFICNKCGKPRKKTYKDGEIICMGGAIKEVLQA